MKTFFSFLFLILVFSCHNGNEKYTYDTKSPQLDFAVKEIKKAEQESNGQANLSYKFELKKDVCQPGGFQIQVIESNVLIQSADTNGLMYGGLEIAEQLQLNGKVSSTLQNPFISRRGIKYNIPLDARTPGYDDTGDAAQQNIAEMWEWDFWKKFLDQLARDRYNMLSFWNPLPFPSMIKMDKYPDVALDDVMVTTLKPTGEESEWAEPQMVSSNVVENLKTVKKITIDEKIAFWQKVMQYAHDRGIDIYYVTWNICPNSVANPLPPFYRTYDEPLWDEKPGKYGVTHQMDNPKNIEYYQDALKTFLETYPNVKGIGITAGEHLLNEANGYTREQWIWEAYGEGIINYMKSNPDRKIDFIHRAWNANVDKFMNYWKNYPASFELSYKYAWDRTFSSPHLPFAAKQIEAARKYGLKSWWHLRNDDIYVYRWGDSDFVREFIKGFPEDVTAGYFMGSDGYVWGKEFSSINPNLSGQLEIEKHWFNFMLWGRLGYNNELDNSYFIQRIQNHFPETDATQLFNGWQQASKIIPLVNVFHWRPMDFQWSIEACVDQRYGFHDVTMFINNPTLEGSHVLSPTEYAKNVSSDINTDDQTPLQVIANLNEFAAEALKTADLLDKEGASVELKTLLDDMRAMAYLGQYYGKKIEAATELALYRNDKKEAHRQNAVKSLEDAVQFCDQYRAVSEKNYKPQMLARTRELNWSKFLESAKKDVEIARTYRADSPFPPYSLPHKSMMN